MAKEQYRPEELITLAQAAELAGVTRDTIRRWFDVGYLHAVKIGYAFFTTREELRRTIVALGKTSGRRLGEPSPELMAIEPKEQDDAALAG